MTLPYHHLAPPVDDSRTASTRRPSSRWTPVESDEESTFHPAHPDAETILRIRADDRAAFTQLFHDRYQRLWAFAYDLTGSADYAEEVVQDIFAFIWIYRAEWVVPHSIAEYLFDAVINCTDKMCRHLAIVDPTATIADLSEGDPALALDGVPPRLDEAAEHTDRHRYVTNAIRAMPPRRRTALLLRWYDGLSYNEIASVIGVSVRTASFQLLCVRDDLWALVKKRSQYSLGSQHCTSTTSRDSDQICQLLEFYYAGDLTVDERRKLAEALGRTPEFLDTHPVIRELNQAVTDAALYNCPDDIESAYGCITERIARDEQADNAAEETQVGIEKRLFGTNVSFASPAKTTIEHAGEPRALFSKILSIINLVLSNPFTARQK